MKKMLVLLMLLTSLPFVTFGQTDRDAKTEQEIIALYREFQDAMMKRDVAALERILADDYTDTDLLLGTMQTKADIIKVFKANPQLSGSAGKGEITNIGSPVSTIRRDTAILTSRSIHKGQDPKGQAFSVPVLLSVVLSKEGGRWRIIATHGCRIDRLQSEPGTSPTTARSESR